MPFIFREGGIQEGIHNHQRQAGTDNPSAHRQDIGVIVLTGRFRGEAVMADSRADPLITVCCYGDAESGPADQNSLLALSAQDALHICSFIDWIVCRLRIESPEILIFDSFLIQVGNNLLHEIKSAVVTAQSDHIRSPSRRCLS